MFFVFLYSGSGDVECISRRAGGGFFGVVVKSRFYLINDGFCNCRFSAYCVSSFVLGFLDVFGVSGLTWARCVCELRDRAFYLLVVRSRLIVVLYLGKFFS